MRSRKAKGNGVIKNWRADGHFRPFNLLVLASLAAGLLFGGGGAIGPFNNGLLAALGALLLGCVFTAHFSRHRPLPDMAVWPIILLLVVLLLGGFQLLPWSNAPWLGSEGRQTEVAILALLGDNVPRALSLDTEATVRAMAAFLLPAGLLLAALGATRKQRRGYLLVITAAAILHAIVGALQVALGSPDHLEFYAPKGYFVASGFFANPNHFGTMMVLGMLAAAGLVIERQPAAAPRHRPKGLFRRLARWFSGWASPSRFAFLGLIIFFAALTQAADTRAGLLLLLLATPLAIAVVLRLPLARGWAIIALLLPIAAIAVIMSVPSLQQQVISSQLMGSDDIRFVILPDLIFVLNSFWPWGFGMGAFDTAFRANENLDMVGQFYVNRAHNDWLEWLMETGIAGAILLAASLITVFALTLRAWVHAKNGSSRTRLEIILSVAAIGVVMLHSVFDYPVRITAIAAALMMFIAFAWQPWEFRRDTRPAMGRGPTIAIGVAFGLAMTAIAANIVSVFAAQAAFQAQQHASAVSLNPRHGSALAALAARAKQDDDPAQTRAIASRALIERPYSANAMRAIAVSLEREERVEDAGVVWSRAAALGWRDPPTQLWAFLQALNMGEFDIAAIRADALFRTNRAPTEFRQQMWVAAADPEFRAVLTERLDKQPDWRTSWLAAGPGEQEQALDGADALMRALAKKQQISPKEAAGAIRGLLNHGRPAQAYRLYCDLFCGTGDNLLTDGEFERDPELYEGQLTPFDWNFERRPNVLATVEGREDAQLYIETDGDAARPVLERALGLAPGDYELSFTADRLDGDLDRFTVAMICLGGSEALAQAPLRQGTQEEPQRLDFTVPADCPVVMLAIVANVADRFSSANLDSFAIRARP